MSNSKSVLVSICGWLNGRTVARSVTLSAPHVDGLKVHLWALSVNPRIKSEVIVLVERNKRFVSWHHRTDHFHRMIRLYHRKLDNYQIRQTEAA